MTLPFVLAAAALSAGEPHLRAARQVTHAPHGHVLANRGCWSADGRWLLYDLRTDETVFDGRRIEAVNVDDGAVRTLIDSPGAPVGVPTCAPRDDRFVFLRGPAEPTGDWRYAAWHRHGALARLPGSDGAAPNAARVLDARDLAPPFTPGALRGGTHLHTFSPDGTRVASTYDDHLLATAPPGTAEANRRVVAVTQLGRPVEVSADHPRNQSGAFTVVVTTVHDEPAPGSDQIGRAYSDAWVGGAGSDRIAFLGEVTGEDGATFSEIFLLTLPDDLARPGAGPLAGTATTRPAPPAGVTQRRLTDTADKTHPGTAGPRFWPVSSPDGAAIGFYRKDEHGRVRFCTVDPREESAGGAIVTLTNGAIEPTSAFTWSPDGTRVAFAADGSLFVVRVETGGMTRLTPQADPGPTHHACVWSPDGSRIAYAQPVDGPGGRFDQLFVVSP